MGHQKSQDVKKSLSSVISERELESQPRLRRWRRAAAGPLTPDLGSDPCKDYMLLLSETYALSPLPSSTQSMKMLACEVQDTLIRSPSCKKPLIASSSSADLLL